MEIESELDPLAPRLWGLTEDELKEIQESLEELGEKPLSPLCWPP
jgi:hypothetical protein